MFVKFSCGCKGILGGGFIILLDSCDRDDFDFLSFDLLSPSFGNTSRYDDLINKPYELLESQEVFNICSGINELIYKGFRFNDVRNMLSLSKFEVQEMINKTIAKEK